MLTTKPRPKPLTGDTILLRVVIVLLAFIAPPFALGAVAMGLWANE